MCKGSPPSPYLFFLNYLDYCMFKIREIKVSQPLPPPPPAPLLRTALPPCTILKSPLPNPVDPPLPIFLVKIIITYDIFQIQ